MDAMSREDSANGSSSDREKMKICVTRQGRGRGGTGRGADQIRGTEDERNLVIEREGAGATSGRTRRGEGITRRPVKRCQLESKRCERHGRQVNRFVHEKEEGSTVPILRDEE